MSKHGKIYYQSVTDDAGTVNAKFQGGGSTGKEAKFKPGAATEMTKSIGTPRDKGVNR